MAPVRSCRPVLATAAQVVRGSARRRANAVGPQNSTALPAFRRHAVLVSTALLAAFGGPSRPSSAAVNKEDSSERVLGTWTADIEKLQVF